MREETLERIAKETAGLPERWRAVLTETLLEGTFPSEADRLLSSAVAVHDDPPDNMKRAESILAGDAFIPMAVCELMESGASLSLLRRKLEESSS